MKCLHCGQEHPDNFQFCPVTGQKLVPPFEACTNEQCPEFGKYVLPLDSRLCPSCGKPLEHSAPMTNEKLTFSFGGVSFNMILVEHGSFMMGATDEQQEPYDGELPVHEVTITNDYYIGETQVTQALWTAVMGNNPSKCEGDDKPVNNVSWDDCQKFISTLNRSLRNELAEKIFRLPTEAEWEFAARGGNKSERYRYAGSDDIDEVAWYLNNSDDDPHPVARLKPNELGIFDMSGNVCEVCRDWDGDYTNKSQVNPTGPDTGSYRIVRGGGWGFNARLCRVSCRCWNNLDDPISWLGLRLVLQVQH